MFSLNLRRAETDKDIVIGVSVRGYRSSFRAVTVRLLGDRIDWEYARGRSIAHTASSISLADVLFVRPVEHPRGAPEYLWFAAPDNYPFYSRRRRVVVLRVRNLSRDIVIPNRRPELAAEVITRRIRRFERMRRGGW